MEAADTERAGAGRTDIDGCGSGAGEAAVEGASLPKWNGRSATDCAVERKVVSAVPVENEVADAPSRNRYPASSLASQEEY